MEPIKMEVNNEEKPEISDTHVDNMPFNEGIEKDIPDFVNVDNFVGIVQEERREIYYCTYCNKKFLKFEYLQIHEHVHDAQKHCPICDFTFAAKKDFIVHINGHVKEKMEDEMRSLCCKFCNKSFKKRTVLTLHLRVHTNERPFKCNVCGKAFKRKGSLGDHNKTHTNDKTFHCEICAGSFATPSSLKRHVKRIHDAGKTYFCKICSQKLPNYASLQQHRAEQHPLESERHQCPICFMIFKSSYSYKKHRKEVVHENKMLSSKAQYRCILCGWKFVDHKLYMQHKDKHSHCDKKDFQKGQQIWSVTCRLCQKVYQNKQTLFKHMMFHMKKTKKCNICRQFFSYYGYSNHRRRVHLQIKCKMCKEIVEGTSKLIRHYRTTHSDLSRVRDGKNSCRLCHKSYKSTYPLELHMQICHKETNIVNTHKCKVCGKGFTTRAILGVHMARLHPTSARFRRESCNVLFQTHEKFAEHNVPYHRRSVEEYKKSKFATLSFLHHKKKKRELVKTINFRCKICWKYFKNFRNYIIHFENEVCTKFYKKTQKNFYECTDCQREFTVSNAFAAHMMIHSKFYKTCRFCRKTFSRTHTLRTHIESVHFGEKLYYCGFCDMEFEDLSQLKKHEYTSSHRIMIQYKTECKIEVAESEDRSSVSEEIVVKEEIEVKKELVEY